MIDTILVIVGALMASTFAGALLAPAGVAARRTVLACQWPTRQTTLAASGCRSQVS